MWRTALIVLALASGASLARAQTTGGASFVFTAITIPGLSPTVAGVPDELNDRDQVAGSVTGPSSAPIGFVWQNGSYQTYPQAAGLPVINNAGLAAGPAAGGGYVTVNTVSGLVTYTADGFTGTIAAINLTGNIAATQGSDGVILHGSKETFVSCPASTSSQLTGINDKITAVGSCTNIANQQAAFLYSAGTYTRFTAGLITNPVFINNAGQVGGSETDPSALTLVGFVRSASGAIAKYSPPNAQSATVTGIGPNGQIVGTFEQPGNGVHQRGFVFVGGAYYTINYPGATDTTIDGINARGTIVGTYTDAAGAKHPYVGQCVKGRTCTQ